MESQYPDDLSSKESQIKRFKPIWRILLISNLALGAYMFAMARQKNLKIRDSSETAKKSFEDTQALVEDFLEPTTTPTIPKTAPPAAVVLKPKEPIAEDQQRDLFKWILEDKRKVQPKDLEEKKRIDEDKALLKQFIRAKPIPSL